MSHLLVLILKNSIHKVIIKHFRLARQGGLGILHIYGCILRPGKVSWRKSAPNTFFGPRI